MAAWKDQFLNIWSGFPDHLTLATLIDWRIFLRQCYSLDRDADDPVQRIIHGLQNVAELENGEWQLLFAFVDAEEQLADEETLAALNEPSLARYFRLSTEIARASPTNERILDCIAARHLADQAKMYALCPVGDSSAGLSRRKHLEGLFRPEHMAVVTAWLSLKNEFHSDVLKLLEPASWHLVVLHRTVGIPVLRTRAYGDLDYQDWRMIYLGPVLPPEELVLTEILSLNFLPDAFAADTEDSAT